MRRLCAVAGMLLLLFGSSGCGSTVESGSLVFEAGSLILNDSLTAIDDRSLPCCSHDSADVQLRTIAGTLTFYAAARYQDSVATPAGWKPRACVQEVPNDSQLALNQLLTLADGSSYLLLPCSIGVYQATIVQLIERSDGSGSERQTLLSSGAFSWSPNRLSLTEQATATHPTTELSGATITLSVQGHRYRFLALPRR